MERTFYHHHSQYVINRITMFIPPAQKTSEKAPGAPFFRAAFACPSVLFLLRRNPSGLRPHNVAHPSDSSAKLKAHAHEQDLPIQDSHGRRPQQAAPHAAPERPFREGHHHRPQCPGGHVGPIGLSGRDGFRVGNPRDEDEERHSLLCRRGYLPGKRRPEGPRGHEACPDPGDGRDLQRLYGQPPGQRAGIPFDGRFPGGQFNLQAPYPAGQDPEEPPVRRPDGRCGRILGGGGQLVPASCEPSPAGEHPFHGSLRYGKDRTGADGLPEARTQMPRL